MDLLAHRIQNIKPSPTLAMTARAMELRDQGHDIISLSAGEPDFDTPDHIKQAAAIAMAEGKTKYTDVAGTAELRNAIVTKLKRDNNLDYRCSEISVSTGGKQVIYNALISTLNPGDEVIIPAPYWVSYPDIVVLGEGVPVFVNCPEFTDFKMTPRQLEQSITPKTKWLILNSPSNPTGAVYNKEELKALADVLSAHPHVMILSDDIYEYLTYDNEKFFTLATLAPDLKNRILIVNGVSKSYAMTGWRIGYGAGPEKLIKAMNKLQSQCTSNASSISQAAALAALNGSIEFLGNWKKAFVERRDLVIEHLLKIPGLTCVKPHGAFYLYIGVAGLIGKTTPKGSVLNTDDDVVLYLLEEAGVAAVSGSGFGLSPFFRISYATSSDILHEACDRIERAVVSLGFDKLKLNN